MTTWKTLSRPLRCAIVLPWLLLAMLTGMAQTPGFRALLLDDSSNATVGGTLSANALSATGASSFDGGLATTDGSGNFTANSVGAGLGYGGAYLSAYGNVSGNSFSTNSGQTVLNDGGLTVDGTTIVEPSGIVTDYQFVSNSGMTQLWDFGLTIDGHGIIGLYGDLYGQLNCGGQPINMTGLDSFYADGVHLYYTDSLGTTHTLTFSD